jgi:hypothetical protein
MGCFMVDFGLSRADNHHLLLLAQRKEAVYHARRTNLFAAMRPDTVTDYCFVRFAHCQPRHSRTG